MLKIGSKIALMVFLVACGRPDVDKSANEGNGASDIEKRKAVAEWIGSQYVSFRDGHIKDAIKDEAIAKILGIETFPNRYLQENPAGFLDSLAPLECVEVECQGLALVAFFYARSVGGLSDQTFAEEVFAEYRAQYPAYQNCEDTERECFLQLFDDLTDIHAKRL